MRYPAITKGTVKVASSQSRSLLSTDVWRVLSFFVAIVASVYLCFAPSISFAAEGKAQPQLPTVTMLIDGNPLTVELATTGQQRYMGLSFRQSMEDNSGMLFVYTAERPLTFTMRNTLIPLSIAFISKDMVINEIHHMNVGPNQLFDARADAQYALEVNQGWFEENGIKAGTAIVLK